MGVLVFSSYGVMMRTLKAHSPPAINKDCFALVSAFRIERPGVGDTAITPQPHRPSQASPRPTPPNEPQSDGFNNP